MGLFKFIFLRYYKMASFENVTSEESIILAKLRNADNQENMFRQELENMFAATTTPKTFPRLNPRPKKFRTKKIDSCFKT